MIKEKVAALVSQLLGLVVLGLAEKSALSPIPYCALGICTSSKRTIWNRDVQRREQVYQHPAFEGVAKSCDHHYQVHAVSPPSSSLGPLPKKCPLAMAEGGIFTHLIYSHQLLLLLTIKAMEVAV